MRLFAMGPVLANFQKYRAGACVDQTLPQKHLPFQLHVSRCLTEEDRAKKPQ